jgi:beta-lactamase regulating signal transducer with metallopeptidase domain/uncharacterized GH25 family protein
MLNAIIDQCNSFAHTWARWIGMSILDAAIILTIVALLWFAIRRKAPPQLGYLLFLLVPLKLFVPLDVAIPERFLSWAPIVVSSNVGQQPSPNMPQTVPRSIEKTDAMPDSVAFVDKAKDRHEALAKKSTPTKTSESISRPVVEKHSNLSFFAWLMLAWFLGVLALLVRLIVAQIHFQRLVIRTAKPIDQSLFSVDYGGLLQQIRVKGHIRIVESDCISSPVVWGIFRPTLILPVGITKSLSNRQLEWVLLHELAHVRRHDLIVSGFQRAVGILYFINPSIWIANHMINRLREYACDDMALAYGRISHLESGEAFLGVIRYAASIQRRPETNLEGAIGMFESTLRSSCFHRMTRLLDTNRRVSVKLRLGSLCLLLLTAVLALPQIRAANPQAGEEKATEKTAEKTTEKATEQKKELRSENSGPIMAEKKKEDKDNKESIYRFNVVIARRVMLLEGKDIVTWPQIEEIISKRPNPSKTEPSFYGTRGADETGMYESAKKEIWRLHQKYKLIGHSEGSLSALADFRYDNIKSAADLKPDESLRFDGSIVNQKGDPISGAEVILVTPIDKSISYKTHGIYLVNGRVRNPLEEVMTHSSDKGHFALYPPKDQNFFIIAMHPDGGIGYSGMDQFNKDHNIHLLPWAGLLSEFSKEPEKQEADIRTRIKQSGDIPGIEFIQYWIDLKKEQPTLRFGFTRIPPIVETTISRSISKMDGGAISLPGASVGLLPGETRRLDLGPLTEQQRQQLDWMRNLSKEPQDKPKPEKSDASGDDKKAGTSSTSKAKTTDDAATVTPNNENRFELTVLGPDKKPVPRASVEIRGSVSPTAEHIQRGTFIKKGEYGVFFLTDANGSLILDLPKKPSRFDVSIQEPGYGPYWAGWSSDEHPEAIPTKFVAELEAGWSVGGVIVDDQGVPIEGVEIHPSIDFKMRPGDTKELGVGTVLNTNAEGVWQFDSVPVARNEVFVQISHPDFKPNRRALTRSEFGIQPGNKPAAKIEMRHGITFTGKVTDETGKPISGALVRTKFLNDTREAKTDENGEYKLVGCDPKMARVVVSAKGRAIDMKEVSVEPNMEPVNFEMKPGGKIRIQVLNEKGDPSPNARIFFQRWRGMFQYFEFDHVNQYADKNGVWQWDEAPLDEFKVDICPSNGMQLALQPLVARDEEYVFRTSPQLVITGNVIDSETKETIKSFRVVPGIISNELANTQQPFWKRDKSYIAKDGRYRLRFDRGASANLVRIEADGYKVAESRKIKNDEGDVQIDFALTKAKDIAATVLTPDGQPAAGAKIALGIAGSQINITNGNIDDRSTYATRQDVDDAGRFSFPSQDAAYQLVITHPSGFSYLKSPEQEIPSTISLTPWARVEGTFRVRSQPVPNVPITINAENIHSYGKDLPSISTQNEVTTGVDGKFVFERVFSGNGRIRREIRLMVNEGATEVTSACAVAANFPAGKTTHIDLGGSGRPVIGKIVPPSGYKEKVLWNFAMIDIQADLPKPKSPPIPSDVKDDSESSKAWLDAWQNTDEGKAWQATYETYEKLLSTSPRFFATVDRDGSFRIDDVPSGVYALDVRFVEHSAGHVSNSTFQVPPIDGNQADKPLDLGWIALEKN